MDSRVGGCGPKRGTGISAPATRRVAVIPSGSAAAASSEPRSTRCGPGGTRPSLKASVTTASCADADSSDATQSGWASDSAAAMKRVPTRTPDAPAASAAATPRAVAIPPAATTGTATASSTPSSSGRSVGPSTRLRPPDSHAFAMTTSQPAASAARASSAVSTCQPQTAPAAWTRSTSAGSASPRKKST